MSAVTQFMTPCTSSPIATDLLGSNTSLPVPLTIRVRKGQADPEPNYVVAVASLFPKFYRRKSKAWHFLPPPECQGSLNSSARTNGTRLLAVVLCACRQLTHSGGYDVHGASYTVSKWLYQLSSRHECSSAMIDISLR